MKTPSLASSSASGRTRSTSPLKRQWAELRLEERGFETEQLDVDALEDLPNPQAASLLRVMRRIGARRGILPDDLREKILRDHNIRKNDLEEWDIAFKDSDAFDGIPCRIPTPSEIRLVCEWNKECTNSKHEEAGWNDEVHFRLLQAILREPGEKKGGLFNITTCNTARPHRIFLPKSSGSKMVDFCVYADSTQQDVVSVKTYEAFCNTNPTKSVNHTDFLRLQMHPIVLSIETKAENQSLDKATLQVGTWHAAQWEFLRSSLLYVKRASAAKRSVEQEVKEADEALSRLPFIPAVIVQGHRWLFVLSTRQDEKTLLWKEYQFGSTSSVVETYQAVAGLRELISWAEKIYLPWFQKEILAFHKPRPKPQPATV
ncbi:uncharacterized protein BKA55DRAFT_600089 [Fusarium redolens]|uniref:PD-(D/E)XK nuclease-like domain-containing protein n=1 Tax=Fusarium redolens TaxID=48865 RepID=A0A9P9FXB9_FUSRE|nr:uncharacterized protein BKA55DRAFT_600089 [Fusarium redolens]KAH7208501.1 hypothetical protein BKA55DRAFT_600089 [Fusarium redolens]